MIRCILTCLALLMLYSDMFSQGHIVFNHLTIEDGLSQSSVTCIFQDRKGFMWFGTQDGLNRFDGYNFKIFKSDPADPSSLSDNFIFSIYENPIGILFIETQSGKFHQYFPETESFKVVDKDSTNLNGAKVSTVGSELTELSGITWKGGLGTGTGLSRFDKNTGQTIVYKHNPDDPYSLGDNKIYSIFRDDQGNLWIGTFNGLDRFDEETGKFYHYRNNPKDPNSLADNWVWPIFQDSHGYLWIGTVRSGLCRFDPAANSFINYKYDSHVPTSINDNFVFSIYEDRSGVIWVGTNLGGLNYFHPSTQTFENYQHNPGNNNSLSDNIVNAIAVDKRGIYWIGTRNGGLNRFNYAENKFVHYTQTSSVNSVSGNAIVLYPDRSGLLWVGTYSSGLDVLNISTGETSHYLNDPSDPNSLSDNRVYSLAEDQKGNMWIGTYGGGLNRLDRSTGKIYRYQSDKNNPASLHSNATWSLAFDEEGDLWVGTYGGGVNILNIKKGTFTHLKNIPGDPTSLADDNVIRVFKDLDGNMWVGTAQGLCRYLKETGNFRNYNEKDGLSNNFVYGIVEDGKKNLWLSTNNGLSRFNPRTEKFKNFYYENGLQGNEFNQNAFAKDNRTGRLLFGGPNGFNVFHPDSVRDNPYVPPVVFSNYIRYNTDDEEGKPIPEKGISERDSIFLTYKDNIITLDFSALSYYNNYQNQYQYKLQGFNKNWIQLGNKHNVTFTNLSPGEYNLTVLGSNNDGVWNETGSSIYIEVTPPWWRTKIAYAVYGIIFVSVLLGLRKFENDRKEQKAKIRETELRIKATEAEKRAIQIENDRKTKELEEARALQLSMLPKELPSLPNLEIAAFMRTATEVGGDYYDFIVEDDGALNVAFGDATGHGLQAGTMVTLMKGFFTSDASRLGQQEFMNHCSRMIKEIKLGRILMSFTFLRFLDGTMKITSAGMPPVYHYNNVNKETEEIIIKGMPLGAMKKFAYKLETKQINKGDTILLLSDGLPEQMNSNEEMFDYSRVKNLFSEISGGDAQQIIEKLVEAGDRWMDGAVQLDDMSFVVIKVK